MGLSQAAHAGPTTLWGCFGARQTLGNGTGLVLQPGLLRALQDLYIAPSSHSLAPLERLSPKYRLWPLLQSRNGQNSPSHR